jgi:hypothetical protein
MRTGRDGYVCARATRDTAGSAAAPVARRRKRRQGSSPAPLAQCGFAYCTDAYPPRAIAQCVYLLRPYRAEVIDT